MIELKEKTFIMDGEEIEYYPVDFAPPHIDSPLDHVKYDNDDESLDDVLANLGGHFCISNADILNEKW